MSIKIDEKEFKKLIDELKKLRAEKEELVKAVNFLNEQIKEYNRRFADVDSSKE